MTRKLALAHIQAQLATNGNVIDTYVLRIMSENRISLNAVRKPLQ